jgi:hypothetical protein
LVLKCTVKIRKRKQKEEKIEWKQPILLLRTRKQKEEKMATIAETGRLQIQATKEG